MGAWSKYHVRFPGRLPRHKSPTTRRRKRGYHYPPTRSRVQFLAVFERHIEVSILIAVLVVPNVHKESSEQGNMSSRSAPETALRGSSKTMTSSAEAVGTDADAAAALPTQPMHLRGARGVGSAAVDQWYLTSTAVGDSDRAGFFFLLLTIGAMQNLE
ncbi:hypothetical protein C8F01DRAFT_1143363 [Mycena amicta]|nr:hypothetical protein C8F01DRAFT_1143363 [Mycena amicta]